MNWFWHALWICLVVIPVTLLWAVCIFDIVVHRRGRQWWQRILWLVLVLFVPLLGALIYAGVNLAPHEDVRSRSAATDLDYEEPPPVGAVQQRPMT